MGVDLVPVERMERLLREQPAIRDRVFTGAEQRYCEGRRRASQHYAARFAAKEAVLKAFGTGLASGMEWTDIEIVHARSGRPTVQLAGVLADHARARGLVDLDLSLSHTTGLAMAHAVARFTT
ncbi:MAG TPA: holo-ACP synthase [Euzebya sp.]|nr:holo-ACP synthase [Euzebya sp.]